MNYVSCDICVYHLGLFGFFPEVFLSSRVNGACPVTTDLIIRVNVMTTTTTIQGEPCTNYNHAAYLPWPVKTQSVGDQSSGGKARRMSGGAASSSPGATGRSFGPTG